MVIYFLLEYFFSWQRKTYKSSALPLKTRKARPGCPPGSSCGSPDQAPTPAAGSTGDRHRSETAGSRHSASARAA